MLHCNMGFSLSFSGCSSSCFGLSACFVESSGQLRLHCGIEKPARLTLDARSVVRVALSLPPPVFLDNLLTRWTVVYTTRSFRDAVEQVLDFGRNRLALGRLEHDVEVAEELPVIAGLRARTVLEKDPSPVSGLAGLRSIGEGEQWDLSSVLPSQAIVEPETRTAQRPSPSDATEPNPLAALNLLHNPPHNSLDPLAPLLPPLQHPQLAPPKHALLIHRFPHLQPMPHNPHNDAHDVLRDYRPALQPSRLFDPSVNEDDEFGARSGGEHPSFEEWVMPESREEVGSVGLQSGGVVGGEEGGGEGEGREEGSVRGGERVG